jgi:membrane dipeptidase
LDYTATALELHRRYPVVDGHADSILDVLDGKRSLVERSTIGHLDFVRAREAGVTCTVQAVWPDPVYYPVAPRRAAEALDGLLRQIEAAPGVRLALTAQEIRDAHARGELAVLLHIEGAEPLQGSLALLRLYYRLGVRMMGLTWNHRNEVADGSLEEESRGGLTRFGREVVREMNRLGMVIDVAHITPSGFYQVLELSDDPVLFTHGNCRALYDHRRNLYDDQIKALAAKGGVFGISFVRLFMGPETATLRTVADHIDHVVQLLGNCDHVAIGSDFDGCTTPPGLEDVTRLPDLTAELLRRGYREEDLAKILGGNYLRVFSQVLDRRPS